jgi:hypothetical protein
MKKLFIVFIERKLLYFVFRDGTIRSSYGDLSPLLLNGKMINNAETRKSFGSYDSLKIIVHLRTGTTKYTIFLFSYMLLNYHSCINAQQLLVNGNEL